MRISVQKNYKLKIYEDWCGTIVWLNTELLLKAKCVDKSECASSTLRRRQIELVAYLDDIEFREKGDVKRRNTTGRDFIQVNILSFCFEHIHFLGRGYSILGHNHS